MTTKPLPKWVMQRYAILWNKFKNNEFGYVESLKVLKEKDRNLVSIILSQLKRYGWLTIKLNPRDSRKRIYQLISPEKVVSEM